MPCDTVARRVKVEEPVKVDTAFSMMEKALARGALTITTDGLGRPRIMGYLAELAWLREKGMTDLCIAAALGTRQSSAWKTLVAKNSKLSQVVGMHAAAHAAGKAH